jgi:hypothetical protein
MGVQVWSLVVEYCDYLGMNGSRKEIFTMSLRNGPHIWFVNWLNDAPIMLCTLRFQRHCFELAVYFREKLARL